MLYDFTEECDMYGNHHEMFHIAKTGITHDEVQDALESILGPEGWAMDGAVMPEGAYFSTAKEDIEDLAKALSDKFPDATIFGQDCWDYEGYIVCFKNGQPSTDYSARFDTFEQLEDEPDYFEIELLVKAENGYELEAGGGMVHKENIQMMNDFIENGTIFSDTQKEQLNNMGIIHDEDYSDYDLNCLDMELE